MVINWRVGFACDQLPQKDFGITRGHVHFSDGQPADGSFDFGPLTPGTYSFGVSVNNPWAKGYNQSSVFPEKISIGPSETVADLKFTLPPDRPAPSVPVSVQVLDRRGQPIPNGTVFADDATWPDVHSGPQQTDASGRLTLLLRKGSYYDIWAYVNLPDNKQQCAGPVGIAVDQPPAGPIQLKISHNVGNCAQFKKHRPAR